MSNAPLRRVISRATDARLHEHEPQQSSLFTMILLQHWFPTKGKILGKRLLISAYRGFYLPLWKKRKTQACCFGLRRELRIWQLSRSTIAVKPHDYHRPLSRLLLFSLGLFQLKLFSVRVNAPRNRLRWVPPSRLWKYCWCTVDVSWSLRSSCNGDFQRRCVF